MHVCTFYMQKCASSIIIELAFSLSTLVLLFMQKYVCGFTLTIQLHMYVVFVSNYTTLKSID